MPETESAISRVSWRDVVAIRPYRLYVRPFYLSLLHANFTSTDLGYDDAHSQRIANAAGAISDGQIKRLLGLPEWRSRLSAAWFTGLSRRAKFVESLGTLLLERRLGYASQGYCLALALIGEDTCESYLCRYLEELLPFHENRDQGWAIGALAYIRSANLERYIEPALWSGAHADLQPASAIKQFASITQYLQQHRMITTK
jgi:hypothetical protein